MIKLHCPRCGSWYSAASLEDLIKEATEGWEKLRPTKEQWETINRVNNLEKLQKILKEKGHIEALCRPCATSLFLQLAVERGYGLVGA